MTRSKRLVLLSFFIIQILNHYLVKLIKKKKNVLQI